MKRSRLQAELELDVRRSEGEFQQHVLPIQEHIQPLVDFDSSTAAAVRVQLLDGHVPSPRMLIRWQKKQRDLAVYNVRLVGDARQPGKWTGTALDCLSQ